MPEMKGKLEAKNDTTGTISQLTVHRTHMRKVISANAKFTIEIIQHVKKQKIIWESQKTKHTGKLEFFELMTREQSGKTKKLVFKII